MQQPWELSQPQKSLVPNQSQSDGVTAASPAQPTMAPMLPSPTTVVQQAPQTSMVPYQQQSLAPSQQSLSTATSSFGFDLPTLSRENYNEQMWLDIQTKLANPRTVIEGLLLAGYSPNEVIQILETSPLYSQITGQSPTQAGTPYDPTMVPGYSSQYLGGTKAGLTGADREIWTDPQTGKQYMYIAQTTGGAIGWYGMAGGSPDASDGPYSLIPSETFDFLSGGHQLPVRQMLDWFSTGAVQPEVIQAMAAFAGLDPNNFIGQFTNALPKGNRAPLTRMI